MASVGTPAAYPRLSNATPAVVSGGGGVSVACPAERASCRHSAQKRCPHDVTASRVGAPKQIGHVTSLKRLPPRSALGPPAPDAPAPFGDERLPLPLFCAGFGCTRSCQLTCSTIEIRQERSRHLPRRAGQTR